MPILLPVEKIPGQYIARTRAAGDGQPAAIAAIRQSCYAALWVLHKNRESFDRAVRTLRAPWRGFILGRTVTKDLVEVLVAPDTYSVSPEAVLLVAELHGALALCLHDEGRNIGGMLHLRFVGGTGRPSDVTDNTLSSVLVVLDKFKRAVLGNSSHRDDVQARILAHALPPTGIEEPSASLVDLIRADLADGKIECGSQVTRQADAVRVCFQPMEGRVWISRPNDMRGLRATRRAS